MSFSLGGGRNANQLAAFLEDNLEPATRTLDLVRLVFHMCNFTSLTLGFIAVGVSIGYDLSPINVSDKFSSASGSTISTVETRFLIIGILTMIHGLIGAYGFVSRQSRSLIVYGALGLGLLISGGVFSWEAHLKDTKIAEHSRQNFYTQWSQFVTRFDWGDPTMRNQVHPVTRDKDDNNGTSTDEQFIWELLVNRTCQMQFVPSNGSFTNGTEYDLEKLEKLGEYKCNKTTETNCTFQMCNDTVCGKKNDPPKPP
eukprot:sb/3468618/